MVVRVQDLSVAGKREGLAGQRSGLFMDAVRVIKNMYMYSFGAYPKFAVWETLHGKGTAIWASEIEEFPIAVTKYHFGED